MSYAKQHWTVESHLPEERLDLPAETAKSPRPGVPDAQRKQLRRGLADAVYRFLVRSANAGLLSRGELERNLSGIGLSVDPRDLESSPTDLST